MRMAFQVAAQQQVAEEQDQKRGEPWFEFSLVDQDFAVLNKPGPGAVTALLAGLGENSEPVFFAAVLKFLDNQLEGNGGTRIRRLLERNQINFKILFGGDELNPKGVVDTIISLASDGNPTAESDDSSTSPPATGKRSTGRSPGRGSTASG